MQAGDNGYYLKLDKNTTIFGHSTSNCDPDGPKFTKLYRYMDADFVKEHPYIYMMCSFFKTTIDLKSALGIMINLSVQEGFWRQKR